MRPWEYTVPETETEREAILAFCRENVGRLMTFHDDDQGVTPVRVLKVEGNTIYCEADPE